MKRSTRDPSKSNLSASSNATQKKNSMSEGWKHLKSKRPRKMKSFHQPRTLLKTGILRLQQITKTSRLKLRYWKFASSLSTHPHSNLVSMIYFPFSRTCRIPYRHFPHHSLIWFHFASSLLRDCSRASRSKSYGKSALLPAMFRRQESLQSNDKNRNIEH